MTKTFILMSLAVADCIVQRREVCWIAFSNGTPITHKEL